MAKKREGKRKSSPKVDSVNLDDPKVVLVPARELVILTGLSGSGKLSALKTFEDLGYYSVDNLPAELIPQFEDLVAKSA